MIKRKKIRKINDQFLASICVVRTFVINAKGLVITSIFEIHFIDIANDRYII